MKDNNEMLDAFVEGAQAGQIKAKGFGKTQIQAQMLLEMLTIDGERASDNDEEEYIPYRVLDVGQMFWFGMMTFGMGLSIPEEEMELCAELCRPAWVILCLTNDLFPWPKEYNAAVEDKQPDVVNAIWVLMGEHSITTAEAEALCREKIKEAVAEYAQVVKEIRTRTELSLNLRRYIEALQYHPKASYNDRQLQWMRDGVPKVPKIESFRVLPGKNGVNGSKPVVEPAKATVNGHGHTPAETANGSKSMNGVHGKRGVKRTFEAINNINNLNTAKQTNGAESIVAPSIVQPKRSQDLFLEQNLPDLDGEVLLAPFIYLSSLPSKGVRDQLIDALNVWWMVPAETLQIIKRVISILHGLSLILDDIEDSSPLRRTKPSTHTIFGREQTINSATYQIIQALDEVRNLNSPQCLQIFSDETRNLFIGQSLDLHWTCNMVCPSISEYLKMLDNKTGGLFRLLAKLMNVKAITKIEMDTDRLSTLVGRYFQIRDDYQNLTSNDYAKQKGFCEDLDEGKYSLPLIHALEAEPKNMLLHNMLMQRRVAGHSTRKHKELMLEGLKRTKSMEYTAEVLGKLLGDIEREIGALEETSGVGNVLLRLLLNVLQV